MHDDFLSSSRFEFAANGANVEWQFLSSLSLVAFGPVSCSPPSGNYLWRLHEYTQGILGTCFFMSFEVLLGEVLVASSTFAVQSKH